MKVRLSKTWQMNQVERGYKNPTKTLPLMPHHVLNTDSGKLVTNFKTTGHIAQKLKGEENILTKTGKKGKESSLKIKCQ